ncbi:hypothetical protein Dip510_000157 [Elusimicrobium posterum]|uniref:pirin family protein n=1 Tax=Elusimicrobium posterum TaxID=3116653 RepID=UPI003C759A66
MKIREIKKVVTGTQTRDGAGVKLTRVLSRGTVKDFDPFLMLDSFDSSNPEDYEKGFPFHPHRGIETVTYLIEGDIEHQDSMGNKGSINDGCSQWMTAGSGIIHQEMPNPAMPRMLGVQLWVNLPKKDKMTAPAYRDIRPNHIPKIKEENAVVGVVSGSYKSTQGAVQGDYVKVTFLDIDLKPGKIWEAEVPENLNFFAFIILGSAAFGTSDELIAQKSAVLLSNGGKITAKAGGNGARILLIGGEMLREDVAWGGPIVMNSQDELEKAFEELEDGTFIKDNHPKDVKIK